MMSLASAARDLVISAFGVMPAVRVGSDVDQVAAKDVVVNATFELRREFQEWRGGCSCCGTAHVSCVYLNGRIYAYILFCGVKDLLRFNNLDGLSG